MPTKPEFTSRYKVRNWPKYNRALIRRGQLTLWFDETTVAGWRDVMHGHTTQTSAKSGNRGICVAGIEWLHTPKSRGERGQ